MGGFPYAKFGRQVTLRCVGMQNLDRGVNGPTIVLGNMGGRFTIEAVQGGTLFPSFAPGLGYAILSLPKAEPRSFGRPQPGTAMK